MPYRRLSVFLLLCSTVALAQFRGAFPKPEAAENTVREFCRLDYLGGRLSPAGWARMKSLTSWTSNPAWKAFHVVSRYEKTDESTGFHSARITVRYMVLGRFELGIGYTPVRESQQVEFKSKENDGVWRIESTDPEEFEPEVSQPSAVQWLQEKLKSTTEAADKASIESALKQLQAK